MIKQKIKQKVTDSIEQLKKETVKGVKNNFTLIRKEILEQLTGKEQTQEQGKGNNNFTPFNDEIRDKMGKNFENQDSSQLDEVRKKLAKEGGMNPQQASKHQFDLLRRDEREAIEARKKEKMERQQKEQEEEQKKAEEERRRAQAQQSDDEPGTKQKRGMLFGGKKKKKAPQQTVENKAAKGKQ